MNMRLRDAAREAVRRIGLPVALTVLASTAIAHHVGEAYSVDQQVIVATNQFLAALTQYEKLTPSQKSAALANLTQLAQARQQALLTLIPLDARVAAARMLPQKIRARVPAAPAAYVEQEVHVQGIALFHVADDFEHGRSKATFKLQGATSSDNVYLADPTGGQSDLAKAAGRRLALSAMRVGSDLVLFDKKQLQGSLQAAGTTTGTTSTSSTTTGTVVQGNQNTLSILVNFSDKALTCTPADVANRLFGTSGATVNNNYQESSRGLVSFSGQAVGPFTINYASTGSCDYSGWANAANAAVKAAGIDPTLYTRVNYVVPMNATCGWTGLAYMPGNQSWVASCGSTSTFSHELGHNLGLHHASTPTSEYGDLSDPMGNGAVVDHNGPNRTRTGWIPSTGVQDVTSSGSYSLATMSTNVPAASPQMLRLAKPDTGEYYYVSLRTASNLDANLGSAYLNTVTVHRAKATLSTQSFLLQRLAAGQSFVDATNGITIVNQALGAGMATVGITFGTGVCARSAPIVALTPASQTTGPGASTSFTVSVTNANTVDCGTGTFNLAQVLPTGFAGSFSSASLAIAPGASASTTWTVGSPTGTPNGTYTLTASASDAGGGTNGSAHASDVVYADTVAPTVAITSPAANATLGGGTAKIAVSASDDMSVKAVEFYIDGKLLATSNSAPYSASWSLRKASSGAHTITARAIDTSGNAAQQSIGVTVK